MLGCGQILSTKLKNFRQNQGGESFRRTVTKSDVRILSVSFVKSSSVFHLMKSLRILSYIFKMNGLPTPTQFKLSDAKAGLILVT